MAGMQEIHALFKKLSSKLDALSHLGLAAKPVITDLEVKVDAPAIAMEEAAPVMVSAAALKAPEEAAQVTLSFCLLAVKDLLPMSHCVLPFLNLYIEIVKNVIVIGAVHLRLCHGYHRLVCVHW